MIEQEFQDDSLEENTEAALKAESETLLNQMLDGVAQLMPTLNVALVVRYATEANMKGESI